MPESGMRAKDGVRPPSGLAAGTVDLHLAIHIGLRRGCQ